MVKENTLAIRGKTLVGTVTKYKAAKTVTVEWERTLKDKKYERTLKQKNKVQAHVPENVELKEGDMVEISECRPVSKSKKFIVTKVL